MPKCPIFGHFGQKLVRNQHALVSGQILAKNETFLSSKNGQNLREQILTIFGEQPENRLCLIELMIKIIKIGKNQLC